MIIEKITEIRAQFSIMIEIGIAAFLSGMLFCYSIMPNQKSREEICKAEIAQAKLTSMQLEGLRQEYSKEKSELTLKLSQKLREECLSKISKHKDVAQKLRCEVCKRMK